ncbi:3-oxoacyl-[acyl-carrier-protein] synthase III C-terminal domain-containing protein, partial [Klebsiella variicola]|uniref:3-oxoacyl-[acyl-carrier-protein] synthase III C-terminal domain-containing protein n=1 Tax=Klebsiella variicola TaxID=244366 RepID=UPI0039C1B174
MEEAPVILDTYANTSSAGSVIAFHKYQDDLPKGTVAVLSSFGAGYSIGSVILRKRSLNGYWLTMIVQGYWKTSPRCAPHSRKTMHKPDESPT